MFLPDVYGTSYCDDSPRKERPLHSAPGSREVIGTIRSDKDLSASSPDCHRVSVMVHLRADGGPHELPMVEFREEEPEAVIVLEARAPWFRIRLHEGSAWLESADPNNYLPLELLLQGDRSYLSQAWDGRLSATPGGPRRRAPADPRRRMIGYVEPVEQVSARTVDAFERPDRRSRVVAQIRTDRADVSLRSTNDNPPAIAVFARRSGWLQVALRRDEWQDEPRAWIAAAPAWRFHGFGSERERDAFEDSVFGREHFSVHLIEHRRLRGALWLRVEVMSHSVYDPGPPPHVVASGWVPALDSSGAPVVWFHSRD